MTKSGDVTIRIYVYEILSETTPSYIERHKLIFCSEICEFCTVVVGVGVNLNEQYNGDRLWWGFGSNGDRSAR